jgi:arylsulfatase A
MRIHLLLAVAALVGSSAPAMAAEAKTPNVVFILADDLGYGDLGCFNAKSKIPTPNLDRLAAQGVRFTDAHSPSAVCSPTRYGIITGRYCWRSRLKKNVLFGYDLPLIEPERLTVASLLRRAGYATACIGKWHLGLGWTAKDGKMAAWPDSPTRDGNDVDFSKPFRGGPNEHGFDYFFGISGSLDMPPYVYLENNRAVSVPTIKNKEGGLRLGWAAADFKAVNVLPDLTEKALGFMADNARQAKPFFLYFALNAPHWPVVPKPEFYGKSKAGHYGDFVCQVDATVGRVLKALDDLKLADNTLVIFTSDNGPEFLAIQRLMHFHHASAYIYRGVKRDLWEGGHRVPFLARWPGKIKPGTTCDETICLTDLMGTCAALSGQKLGPDEGPDSYNILPALLGGKYAQPLREATVLHSSRGDFGIRQGKWMLILCRGSGGNFYGAGPNGVRPHHPPGQLYDLEKDVRQVWNVYRQHPEVVARLTALLEQYKDAGFSRKETTPQSPGKKSAVDVTETADYIQIDTDALQARINKKGYVSGVAAGSLLDKKTGARDAGFGLHIMDFLMAPGWRDDDYSRDPKLHGNLPKHYVEGPQICTQAKKLEPDIIRGKDSVTVRLRFRFTKAAAGLKAGSLWEQTLVFRPGLRYFLSNERITSVNDATPWSAVRSNRVCRSRKSCWPDSR